MRGLAFLLLILAIAGTAVGVGGVAFSFFEDRSLLFPSLALMIVPWGLWVPVRRRVTAQGRAQFEAALGSLEPDVANWYDGSGLAIDSASGKLLVGSRGEVAFHDLAELTEVQFVPESAGSVSAAGASGMGALGAILALLAIGSATSGHLGSGLFLTLGGRKWQVFGLGSEEAGLWVAKLKEIAPHARFKEPE